MNRPPSSADPARNSNCQAIPDNDSDRCLAISVTTQSTYNDGQLYRPAQGRKAPQNGVVDHIQNSHSVVAGRPTAPEFLRAIERELKIRFFTQNTVKSYISSVRRFLNWFGRMPHSVTREDVREYLEVLVDGGASSSDVGTTLSAIRTAFDKMCCRQITLGLATPRKPSRLPVVLNQTEIRMMLEAARSVRDKLLMSLMYGVGLRVSEVSRLRWDELDLERRSVRVVQGKGCKDRIVVLPDSLAPLLKELNKISGGCEFVFPSEGQRTCRHLSARTIQRVVKNTAVLARINRNVTPHSFRHSFATHLVEDGLDIRFLQKMLGHARLETTTVYTRTAVLKDRQINSPLDRLQDVDGAAEGDGYGGSTGSVGRMRLALAFRAQRTEEGESRVREADAVVTIQTAGEPVVLDGITLRETRPGWIAMDVPAEERWRESVSWLNPEQRERVCSVEFFENLRVRLGQRFLAGCGRFDDFHRPIGSSREVV